MGEVVESGIITSLPVPAEKVLQKALEACIDSVVVIGYKDGEFWFSSSDADGGNVLWLLELAKRRLFEAADSYANQA